MDACRVAGAGARGKARDSATVLVERLRGLINRQFHRANRLEPMRTCAEFERLIRRNDAHGIEELFEIVRRVLTPGDEPELAELRRLADEGRAWCRGASGEECVGKILRSLPEVGCVLNDLPLFTRGNIDHVVVCKRGIFAIETKFRRPEANVCRDVAETARRMRVTATIAAKRLRERTPRRLWVFPVLVFVGTDLLLPRVDALPVLWADQLSEWIQSQPERFSGRQVGELAATARKVWRTWR